MPSFGPFQRWADLVIYGNASLDPKTGAKVGGERGAIGYINHQWCFQSWERIPGPGSETVEYYASTAEEIIAVTVRFFGGKAETIEGWLVPMHRFTEWKRPRVDYAIKQAATLSPEEWGQVSRRFDEQYLQLVREYGRSASIARSGPWSWARWFACMVVLLEHENPSSLVLWIRRDLEEAFLVKERCPSCQSTTLIRTSLPMYMESLLTHTSTYKCKACDKSYRRSGEYLVVEKE